MKQQINADENRYKTVIMISDFEFQFSKKSVFIRADLRLKIFF